MLDRSPLDDAGNATARPVHTIAMTVEPIDSEHRALRTDIQELPERFSARHWLSRGQKVTFGLAAAALVTFVAMRGFSETGSSLLALVQWISVAGLAASLVYGIYGSILTVAGFRNQPPLVPYALADDELPGFSVLVPLYHEERVLPALVKNLSAIDYPLDRLQILLLIEESDDGTRAALEQVTLGPQFEVIIIQPELPRTKPKACNIGLRHVRGELTTIYDAEDRPDPDQLRKVAAAFHGLPHEVVCLQAELNFFNPWTNWLSATFSAEYARLFGPVLRGLDRFGLPIPLGGNSNHFRTAALCAIGAWDPYNLTEDADLGIRIARQGWQVRAVPSATVEEANTQLGNWLRQRSRWIKGHMQVYLVHTRSPLKLWRELGPLRFLTFHLTFGLPWFTNLLNPIVLALAAMMFVPDEYQVEAVPPLVQQLALIGVAVNLTLFCIQLIIACVQRGLYRAIPTAFTWGLYQSLMSVAAYKGLIQLLRPSKRFYWELTRHGLVETPTE